MNMQWGNIQRIDSNETCVSKLIFTKPDAIAEAVLYGYPDHATRTVICCSTQSGCPIGCTFCGTGNKFIRNLTTEEIVSQVDEAFARTGIEYGGVERSQIMFMSMGEPVLNKKHMPLALRRLNEKYPNSSLLISTSAPQIDWGWVFDISAEIPAIGLQFSIHESTNEARDRLIPFEAKHPLEEIATIGRQWHGVTGRSPFFNYCIHSANSSEADANRLDELFDPKIWAATVSVICEADQGKQRDMEAFDKATEFSNKLVARGFNTRVFDPAGQDDIGGGCGQLWFVQDWMELAS